MQCQAVLIVVVGLMLLFGCWFHCHTAATPSSKCSALMTWLRCHAQDCVDGCGHAVMLIGAHALHTVNNIDSLHGRWSHVVNDD